MSHSGILNSLMNYIVKHNVQSISIFSNKYEFSTAFKPIKNKWDKKRAQDKINTGIRLLYEQGGTAFLMINNKLTGFTVNDRKCSNDFDLLVAYKAFYKNDWVGPHFLFTEQKVLRSGTKYYLLDMFTNDKECKHGWILIKTTKTDKEYHQLINDFFTEASSLNENLYIKMKSNTRISKLEYETLQKQFNTTYYGIGNTVYEFIPESLIE